MNGLRIVNSWKVSTAEPGDFGLQRSAFLVENCRDRFANKWNRNTKGLFFFHKANEGQNVAAFIAKTEKVLRTKSHSQFALTNSPRMLWVEPAGFWKACPMRRSLFTILLRAGMAYGEQDNYEEALFTHPYLRSTRAATERFLFGYTRYIGERPRGYMGWEYHFRWKTVNEVKAVLVKPGRRQSSLSIFKDELWA